MASNTVTVRVRPLRVAFLVDPTESQALYRAIELSTFLWGGSYNPIIPSFRRTPQKWEAHRGWRLPTPTTIIAGYLDGFDPDLVVPVGACESRSYTTGNREVVKAADLIGDLSETVSPRYGIGFIELLRDFIAKELKYKRSDNLEVVFPELPRAYRLFLSSVFGVLPNKAQNVVDKHFSYNSSIKKVQPTLTTFVDLLKSNSFFPRRLTSWSLEEKPLRDALLFVCDATSTLDIIDYWNLRAAGYYVVPVPIQASRNEAVINLSRDVIEENYQPYRHNPEMYYHTTVQRSRSLSEDTVKRFCHSLQLSPGAKENQPKYILRWWYPRLWDAWARENTQEGIAFPYAYVKEHRVAEGEQTIELRSQDPKFDISQKYTDKPRFANDFSFRFIGSKEPMAEVFPEGSRQLSSAIGRFGFHDWRFSKSGPVFLAANVQELIFLDLPSAEAVMTEWFRERGWKVELSGPGRIAMQLLKQLGGLWGVSSLTHRSIIELLAELEKGSGLPRQAVLGRMKRAVGSEKHYFASERFIRRLLEVDAIRLGAKIQYPVCTRHNWFKLDELDYMLPCRFCLSEFVPPLHSPKDIEWTYRAHGPFATSVAQGAFTVLLTLKFLGGSRREGVTPLFSYLARKNSGTLEADLTCLCKPSTWRERQTHVVHAECKSFNGFEARDLQRMKALSEAFPGSVLIFATLSDELRPIDIQAIRSFALTQRRNKFRRKPSSPIIILTGTELFSERGVPECWKGKGGKHEELSRFDFRLAELPTLADVTQQLYLGLPSYHEWYEAESTKRTHQKKGSRGQTRNNTRA